MTPKAKTLEATLQKAAPKALRDALTSPPPKSKMLTIRISEEELEQIRASAERFGLTVTDYLLRLHRFAAKRVS